MTQYPTIPDHPLSPARDALRGFSARLRSEWTVARATWRALVAPLVHLAIVAAGIAWVLAREAVAIGAHRTWMVGREARAWAGYAAPIAREALLQGAGPLHTGAERVRALAHSWQAPRPPVARPIVRTRTVGRTLLAVGAWVVVIAAGMGAGAGVALYRGFLEAREHVAAYLADPPRSHAATVWSAPVEIRAGFPIDLDSVGDDLLAAGLDRVSAPTHPGQFALSTDAIEVWTAAYPSSVAALPEVHARIVAKNGRVVRIERAGAVTSSLLLPPIPLATLGDPDTHRVPVKLADLSPWLEPALVAMEDERFRSHHGIDLIGMGRALVNDMASDELQGGSTITQQLAKNLFLTRERTIRRKVHEVLYALALEAELDKDELLELYLSEIYLGQAGSLPLHGAEAAARAWFGRSASALDAVQAATLVGVIPAPNAWSPVRNPTGARERRDLVLRKMAEEGYLDAAALQAGLAAPLGIDGLEPSRIRRAPYAVDATVAAAEPLLGPPPYEAGQGLHTAIQPLLQRAAEDAVAAGLAELFAEHPEIADAQAALVAVRISDGAVVALVGGRSYTESPFDRATDAHRQVGSTVKPFTMLAAIEARKAGPNTVFVDEPITRQVGDETWSPQNYDGQYLGPLRLRQVIEKSRNVPSVLLAESVGFTRLQGVLRAAGFAEATRVPSTALGAFTATPLEMAGAWTVFDQGVAQRPRVLLAITDEAGAVLHQVDPERTKVASPAAAAVAAHVLEGVLTAGTGARASKYGVGPPAAGKSGTTDEFRDAWFVGLSREYAVAVWVGRDEGLLGLAGSVAALPTWARFVAATNGSKAPRPRPDGVTTAEICADTGLLAVETCPHRTWEWVLRSMVPAPCTGEGHRDEEGELIEPQVGLDELTQAVPEKRNKDADPRAPSRGKTGKRKDGRGRAHTEL